MLLRLCLIFTIFVINTELVYLYVSLKKKNSALNEMLNKYKDDMRILKPIESCNPLMTIMFSKDGNIKYISPYMLELLSYTEDEIKYMNLFSITNNEDLLIEMKNICKLLDSEFSSFQIDKRFIDRFGKSVWFNCIYACTEDDFEERYIVAYCTEIQWRKQVENNLEESYEFNELVLNSIDTQIVAFDNDGHVISTNKAMEDFCIANNIAPNKDIVSNLKNISDNSKGNDLYRDKYIMEKIKKVFAGERKNYSFEYYRDIDGVRQWYLVNVNSLGEHLGGVATYTDITKLKKLEDEYIKSEIRYKTLLEVLPVAIFLHCDNGIEYSNKAGLELLGVRNLHEIKGTPLVNFVDSDDKLKFVENLKNRDVEFSTSNQRFINALGNIIYVEVDKIPLVYEEEDMILFIVKDITEKIRILNYERDAKEKEKKLQDALEYDKIKTEFFSNISHELRTPINIIFSALQVIEIKIKNDNLNMEIVNYNQMIKQNCYRLLRLVNNLIDITRIDAGFYNIQPSNYDIISIVENITMSVADYVASRNIELVFDTEEEERIICCDPYAIERIMLNLLANAVKFTSSGGSIYVNMSEDDEYVFISVSDTGIGIPQDKLDIIFERFRQADKSFTRSHEGSGIGLSMVKSLVEMQNGSVSVKSIEGEGSEFTIKLPKLLRDDISEIKDGNLWNGNVEKINIEFSDIYT